MVHLSSGMVHILLVATVRVGYAVVRLRNAYQVSYQVRWSQATDAMLLLAVDAKLIPKINFQLRDAEQCSSVVVPVSHVHVSTRAVLAGLTWRR